ncbi:hypothetical protein SAMN04488522_109136 [Pedobacter caeni]|uniref:Uncharacterized protein n=1 Tax=Pedobacter caeni TaxID=288992 RepID=A0A1M5PGM1_9SPHI|nr:hypothetical protein SAMN04488522_109136 [Pedobacter caeni]
MDLLFVIPILISGVVALLISFFTKKKLDKSGNKYAIWISIATFIVSFLSILFAIFLLIISNITIER